MSRSDNDDPFAAALPFCRQGFKRALDIAARAHGAQQTPNDLPYLAHLTAVAMEVMAAIAADGLGRREADLALQCALLHDVLEDTPRTADDLLAMGVAADVVAGVQALTKDASIADKRSRMLDSLRRLQAQPPAVRMVKLADRITNLDPPPPRWSPEKIAAYAAEADDIYEHLHPASPSLASRLRTRLAEYRRSFTM